MARKAGKPGDWWIIIAALLLCSGGLVGIVAAEHGGRVAHLKAQGEVTMARIVGKHEEQRVVDRRKRDTTYMATFFDLQYAPYPATAWQAYVTGGDANLPDELGGSTIQAAVNTGSRAVYDSRNVGDTVAVVVDPDDYLKPELASFVAGFDTSLHWAGAALLVMLGAAAGWQGWRMRQRAWQAV